MYIREKWYFIGKATIWECLHALHAKTLYFDKEIPV